MFSYSAASLEPLRRQFSLFYIDLFLYNTYSKVDLTRGMNCIKYA